MKRNIEKQLQDWKISKNRKPLILKGARQVGKTFSLLEFAEKNYKNYHYINFEKNKNFHKAFTSSLEPKLIIDKLSTELETTINPKEDLIIFDEIQSCGEALSSLKYFCEDLPELHLCAAGSLLGLKLNDISFPVGKVNYLEMFPMTFLEFLENTSNKLLIDELEKSIKSKNFSEILHDKLWEKLKIYFIVGGLPEVVKHYKDSEDDLFSKLQSVRGLQQEIISSYFDDMTKHCGKVNAMHIERLWKEIPNQLAQEQDSSAPKFTFKGVLPKIKTYTRMAGVIDWLEATGLILKVKIAHKIAKPISAYTKENFFKLFVFDVGILGAMSELKPKDILDYDYGTYKGYFAENFVAQELKAYGELNQKLYAWHEGIAEIEFIKDLDGDLTPIEVKSGWVTNSKSLKSYIDRYNPKLGIILSGQNYQDKGRVHKYPLYLVSLLQN